MKTVNVTMIGSCFCGFLQEPLKRLVDSGKYPSIGSLNFQTATTWQRVDAVVDIIKNNIPDHRLVNRYIENGFWDTRSPLGLEIGQGIRGSEWFARRILEENEKALQVANDRPDLL